MELRQIKYFCAVAELKSFTRAAIFCRVTQPALSRQIGALEQELEVELFVRDGRGAHLTPAGAEFFRRCADINGMVKEAADAMQPFRGRRQEISVGAPPSLGPEFLASMSAALTAFSSGPELRLVEGYSYQLADWLASGRLDLALLYRGASHAQAELLASLVESLFLICPGPSIGEPAPVRFAELPGYSLISPDLPSTTRGEMERLARPLGVKLNFKMQIDSVAAIKSMTASGIGHAILPYAAVEQEIGFGLVHARPITDPVPQLKLDLMASTRSGLDQRIYEFSRPILDCLRQKTESGEWKGARLL